MSGHSKWSQIKYKKSATDAKRAKVFTKVAGLITIAAREKGGDIQTNPKLRLAIGKARAVNMPQENIERAIGRGTGALEGQTIEDILLEAYGPGGVAILIRVVTDNRNRTIGEIRSVLNEYSGKLAESGSVKWQFREMGFIKTTAEKWKEEFELEVIDKGAEDFKKSGVEMIITVKPADFEVLQNFLEKKLGLEVRDAGIDFVPSQPIKIVGGEIKSKLASLFEALGALADVEEIYSNAQF